MRAMIVAAGFGTRVRPLTDELPKPALPVGNRPIAWFALDALRRFGLREFLVNTHHLAPALRAALEPWLPSQCTLTFVHEPHILGTGGGVKNAWRPQPDESLVVMSGKLLYQPALQRALDVHQQSGAIATMLLRPLPPDAGFAPVEVDAEGRVWRIRGLGSEAQQLERRMYTSVQILSARAHRDLPDDGDIIEHAYLPWIARGERVMSITDDGPWRDVGVTPRHYLDANLALARRQVRWPGIEPDAAGNLLAPGVGVAASARLSAVVAGVGAQFSPDARLERAVIWPGARVSGALTDVIVTTRTVTRCA